MTDESNIGIKKEGYVCKQNLGFNHPNPELMVPFWEMLPKWVEQGTVMPLAYKNIEGLDAERVNEILDVYRDGRPMIKTHVRLWIGKRWSVTAVCLSMRWELESVLFSACVM